MVTVITVKGVDWTGAGRRAQAGDVLRAYAQASGLGFESETIDIELARPLAWFEEGAIQLDPVLDRVHRGDAVVLSRLASLSSDPQAAVAAVQELVARGVRVFVAELGSGSVARHLDALAVVVGMVGSYAVRVEEAERRADQAEDKAYAEALDNFRGKLAAMAMGGKIVVELPDSHVPQTDPAAGENVRRLRKLAGWNQRQLADALGVDQPSVSRLENTGRPTELLERAARVLREALIPKVATEQSEGPSGAVAS